jgi:hypothetical protein
VSHDASGDGANGSRVVRALRLSPGNVLLPIPLLIGIPIPQVRNAPATKSRCGHWNSEDNLS